jgi:hypothetical protein
MPVVGSAARDGTDRRTAHGQVRGYGKRIGATGPNGPGRSPMFPDLLKKSAVLLMAAIINASINIY